MLFLARHSQDQELIIPNCPHLRKQQHVPDADVLGWLVMLLTGQASMSRKFS